MIEQNVSIERLEEVVNLFGAFDENIRLLEAEYGVSIVCRDENLKICGEADHVLQAQNAVTDHPSKRPLCDLLDPRGPAG